MNKIFSRLAAAASAAVVSVCVLGAFPVSAADEARTITVNFNCLNDDSITFAKTVDPNEAFAPVTVSSSSFVQMPSVGMNKDGYVFSGWTYDGDVGYLPGAPMYLNTLPDDVTEITLEPVFYDGFADSVSLKYEFDKELIGTDPETVFAPKKVMPGQVVCPKILAVNADGATSYTMTDGTHVFNGTNSIIMPDHDVTLTPIWTYQIAVTFAAGDVDRINGNPSVTFKYNEGMPMELAGADRLSRTGYEITGWLSSVDGETYRPGQSVTLPNEDVTYSAVWSPIEYTIVFNAGTGKSADNIKIKGTTDTSIICPENNCVKEGYYFDGWKYGDDIYQPGDEFFIEGAKPGLGIALTSVWKAGTKPVVEPTTVPPTDVVLTDLPGDANNDGEVDLNDAVAILQFAALPAKYPIAAELMDIADVYDPGSGVNGMDALAIQMYDAKSITSLPYIPEKVIVIDDPVA